MASAHSLIEIIQNSQDISGNTSNITAKFYAVLDSGYVYSGYKTYPKLTLDGTTETKTLASYDLSSSNPRVLLGSITKDVSHNADGTKTVSASFSWDPENSYLSTVTGSTTKTLTKIPRYATSNQSLNSKTETTIKMNWSSDATVDYIWYSIDGGSKWTGANVTDGKSGNYTISGLSPNSYYNIKTKVRRKDNQLTTESTSLWVQTYDYPYCTDTPNFTIGDTLTLTLYNPLGRNVTIKGYAKSDGSKIFEGITSGTSASGFKDEYSVGLQYASIKNAKSGAYKVEIIYGDNTRTRDKGNTYSIKGTETPTVGSLSYADTNISVTEITENPQHIVQNKSNLQVTFGVATAKNGASISKYTFELNGVTKTSTSAGGTVDFGVINSASNLTLTMTVTDSRGLTAKTTKTITILPHSEPTAKVSLARLNNYEDETYLTVDGSIASVNGKNTMTIQYRYKVSGGSYGSFDTVGDKVKKTLILDKNNAYIVNVVVTDAFGSEFDNEYSVGKGIFPLFIDTALGSVGINCFPTKEKSIEVNGADISGKYATEEQQIGFWVDNKPLYMKVFFVASPKVTTNGTYAYVTYDTSALNIDFGFVKGAYLKDTNYTFTLPYTNSTGNIVKVYYNRTDNKIEIASNTSTYSGQYCYIILCYTKKTS